MLKLYGRKSGFNVQKVMWLVDELAIPCLQIELGGSFGGLDTPEFRALNPHGRVPVIDDDGTIVWESHAILRYLAAAYGDRHWWNNDPDIRSQVDRWVDWSATTWQPDFLNGIFWGYYRTPEAERNMPAVNKKIAQCADHVRQLDRQLDRREYLLGAKLSLADVTIATGLYRYFNIDIERPRVPNVERYFAALCARPAYERNIMQPFADMYGRLAY